MPDIKVKGYSGNDLSYTDVPKIYLRAADDSGNIPFTYGDAVSKTVEDLDFSEADVVSVDIADGELVTELTIAKPDTLIAENIRYGKEIAGVTGEFLGDTEETTVDLAMADGDQVIEPTEEGKVLTKVTITKPDGAEQVIAKGETLGGIIGAYVTPGTTKEIEPDFTEGDHTENADGDERWNEVIVKIPETLIPKNVRYGIDVGGVVGDFLGDTEEVAVTLDFSEGNQTVEPSEDGKVLSLVTIQQPETLIPSNIASGVEIAGVVGEFVGGDIETEEVTVDLNMSNGDQVIEPSVSGSVMSKVTITKPDTLVPENIADGVDIAGIIGTLASGGSAAKIACGMVLGTHGSGTGSAVTIEHNLGVVPDIFWIAARSKNSAKAYVVTAMGLSSALMEKFGWSYGVFHVAGNAISSSLYGVGSYQFGIDTATSGYLQNPTETTIDVGTTASLYTGTTYHWIAIGGLT